MQIEKSLTRRQALCDCQLDDRVNGISHANARERGFVELEILHLPELRSVFYACARCGRRFEAFYESGKFHFIPVMGE